MARRLRGSRRRDAPALHVLSAFASKLGAVIADRVVEPGQNEIMAAVALLKDLPLDGAIITGDAIFTQREICRRIRGANGHYLFVVKENQPTLKADLKLAFGDVSPSEGPPPDARTAATLDKGHGRIETRKITVSSEVVDYLDWPGLAQVARIDRRRRIGEKESVEVGYLITSLPATDAGPERLLDLARAHWAIENKLHYVRDVTFREDRCRVRAGARPLATLRSLATSLIRSLGLHIPEARENFREDRATAIAAVTGSIL